ncbi:DUF6065 family protein [Novosphingobium album (ex Liu et al. 2023)]|uniref:DUF6065 family protein n=1 Tax=Novosphingobium album (ex Liu et al. 2023) TaxID=3031130 RepID=A0ABT5WQS5_9SPHN|nr:DUF6065 family protein [Novosphingobium album (ex Liu et al. 2023)]MDE8652199.1 DUF6065 family protein [Novosphingobium album (ex Liu et al. 2023)]
MELKCYVYPGWHPLIRVASARRAWMDEAPESFPYRCLPLGIANSHGWEVLSPCGFVVSWNGGPAPEDVEIIADKDSDPREVPQAMFGLGTFTFHIYGLLRTPPGWNIYVSGPPNSFKDGAAPLAGVIETDWAPYTFTMNWKLTRPDHRVRFEKDEPFAHFFPIGRNDIEGVEPRFVPIEEEPELKASFEQWSRSRDAFQRSVKDNPPDKPADKWQKFYYRGLMPEGQCPISDHKIKLQVREFAPTGLMHDDAPALLDASADEESDGQVVANQPSEQSSQTQSHEVSAAMKTRLSKYEWVLDLQERQRGLSSRASAIRRVENLSSQDFLDDYYAPARPVVIAGELADWPASRLWSPEYFKSKVGSAMIEYQGNRTSSADFERYKDNHKTQMPFDRFIDLIMAEGGNNAYLTAYNASSNREALRPLDADIGLMDKFLAQSPGEPGGLLWIGPAGTFTSMHHDLTNNLVVQVVGRKRVMLAAATESPKMYNDRHVFSEVADVLAIGDRLEQYPKLSDVRFHEVVLEPGEAMFIPIGWWHQVEALDFSVTITFTNFRWPNAGWERYPMAD